MICKIHPKGHSFRGLARYVLHDVGAESAERVAWVETRNLATQNPEIAWRIMAATSMSQDRLKQQAGIARTGRKSKAHVLHVTLSWSKEEAPGLTREEMMRAANGALQALSAEDLQVMVVAHQEKEHPHCHLVICRVGMDGRVLSSSNDRLELSKWAEKYESDRGQILCNERVVANAMRAQKAYVRSQSKSRVRYEREQGMGNDPKLVHELGSQLRQDRERAKRQREEHRKLEDKNRSLKREIREKSKAEAQRLQRAVSERFRPQWRELFQEQQQLRTSHQRNENHLIGRAHNALRSINLRSLVKGAERRMALSRAFQVISSSGARLEELKRQQALQTAALRRQQEREERQASGAATKERNRLLVEQQHRFLAERARLNTAHRLENEECEKRRQQVLAASKKRAVQAERERLKDAARTVRPFSQPQRPVEKAPLVKEAFREASRPAEPTNVREEDGGRSKETPYTEPSASERQKRLAAIKERQQQQRDNDRGRGR